MTTIDLDLLAAIIRRFGAIEFRQILRALPASLIAEFAEISERALKARLHAALKELVRARPREFTNACCRARMLSESEIDILWDSWKHIVWARKIPAESVADAVVRQWQLLAPQGEIDVYFAHNVFTLENLGSSLFNSAERLSARLMLTTVMLARSRDLGFDNFRWNSDVRFEIGMTSNAHVDGGRARVDLYAPVALSLTNSECRRRDLIERLNYMDDMSGLWGGNIQIVAPRLMQNAWPRFTERPDGVPAELAYLNPPTLWIPKAKRA